MTINDTIEKSLESIPQVHAFLDSKIERKFNRLGHIVEGSVLGIIGIIPMVMLGGAIGGFGGMIAALTFGILAPPVVIFGVELYIKPKMAEKMQHQMDDININAHSHSVYKIVSTPSEEFKLEVIELLLRSSADRSLVEEVIKQANTNLPYGWWSVLRRTARDDIPEYSEEVVVEPSTQDKMAQLLCQAQSNVFSVPVKKEWRI